ncbi:hypothetical protein RFI_08739 [Reticulomyxa filosa]|uniref:Uncharacterized protein n=1 Tax=Reticulomyxa filosa TaxID=46433 RepID=X6NQY7_RETFI|nr:hypothetical protein RFI_08739 [Reticulomyxa filosa]|eukprot:ETO28396.1 hypothetical protein RFI_08739 [Reticulomyxa filosa]
MGKERLASTYPYANSQGYLTFKNDCGGFNNIRQAFEFFITVAWLTQRTLVFPVTEVEFFFQFAIAFFFFNFGESQKKKKKKGWYLIDWGPMKRAVPENTAGVSNYWTFFDVHDMSKTIAVMNLTTFLGLEWDNLHIDEAQVFEKQEDPNGVVRESEKWNWDTRQRFKKWLNQVSVQNGFALSWGPSHNVLMWPNKQSVLQSSLSRFSQPELQIKDARNNSVDLDRYIGSRDQMLTLIPKKIKNKKNPVTITIINKNKSEYIGKEKYHEKTHLHFPSCYEDDMGHWRYLCQVATTTAFADFENEKKFKRLIRDHVHLVPEAFEIASYVIAELGLFQYASAHIRRNDFQFKGSWVNAQDSFDNMQEYWDNAQPIYVASDAPSTFFKSVFTILYSLLFEKIKTKGPIYRWQDFFGDDFEPDFEDVNGEPIKEFQKYVKSKQAKQKGIIREKYPNLLVPRKLVGVIEMIICAGGHVFFGTTASTYSAYIQRLRGYIDAPDKHVLYHNQKGPEHWGYHPTEYMREFEDMWEDIKDYC